MILKIPFNKPYMTGNEIRYIGEAHAKGHLSGDGHFTRACEKWLENRHQCHQAFLTPSGTAALEMTALLCDFKPGDEVILPSFTFVSTANAFVLRGAVPVFVDIREDTLNLDETKIEAAITAKTKAIVAVHYGGIACEIDTILSLARKHSLFLIEDAAQGILSSTHGRMLGGIGDFGILSFHETKTVQCGEGGALLINNPKHVPRAEMIRQEGTDRARFLRQEVSQYTWHDLGSSYFPSDMIAAFLLAQFEKANEMIEKRLRLWTRYHDSFLDLELQGKVRRPVVPQNVSHNGHLYHLLLPTEKHRDEFIRRMASEGIHTVFHYVPLHESPAGKKFGRCHSNLKQTETAARRIVRLPIWLGIEEHQAFIMDRATQILKKLI